MTHREAEKMLNEIHKNKRMHINNKEARFLEDFSFFVSFENIPVSEKQAKTLTEIHKRAIYLENPTR